MIFCQYISKDDLRIIECSKNVLCNNFYLFLKKETLVLKAKALSYFSPFHRSLARV